MLFILEIFIIFDELLHIWVCFFVTYVAVLFFFFFFQAEDGIRDVAVTGVQTCALPIFVIPGEVFSAVADIGEAGGAVGIQLPLNLQIPLTDVRRDVGRKNGDDADTRRICEVESREIPAGKRRRGLRGIELACRAIWLASQGACECAAKALAVVDAVLTAERRVLRKLIADAAAIEEVENSVAASDYRLAIAGKPIGEADARAKLVVVVRNQAARDGILVGDIELVGSGI